ncbi:MAG: phosphate-starvation-inducible PsiE family protein [Burkholderiales bacterium]
MTLNIYERFEQVIAQVLTALIAVIIVMAVWGLSKEVLVVAWRGSLDPLDHKTFQTVFGQIMTVLIALEFRHTLVKVVAEGKRIIQVKTVLLIAVLALARKFIILETNEYSAATIFALAAVVIALGVTYWLIRDRDARQMDEPAMAGARERYSRREVEA